MKLKSLLKKSSDMRSATDTNREVSSVSSSSFVGQPKSVSFRERSDVKSERKGSRSSEKSAASLTGSAPRLEAPLPNASEEVSNL